MPPEQEQIEEKLQGSTQMAKAGRKGPGARLIHVRILFFIHCRLVSEGPEPSGEQRIYQDG